MESIPVSKKPKRNEAGIALFMVLASISVLAILVTELTYTSQMNQKLAYDGLDQVKALYLAKSGLKLSLLRLKAFQIVKEQIANMSGNSKTSPVPESLIDKIWSFPFFYPIPTSIPGLTIGDKDQIEKFQKSSGLEGNFSAVIESVSSRYNLNSILPGFGPTAQPSTSPGASPTPVAPAASPVPGAAPSPGASPQPYNAEAARQSLSDYLNDILQKKFLDDPDLVSDYRDFRIDDFMDALTAWADPTYELKNSGLKDTYPPKRGPFYSVSELHMLPMMDDQLYDFFAPTLTVERTPGLDINTMVEPTLRSLIPSLTDDEVTEFFKFRDDPDTDNTFQSSDDFFTYLKNSTGAYKNDAAITTLRTNLAKRNIQLIVEEKEFKITVVATVNSATRKIEAWVSLRGKSGNSPSSGSSTTPNPTPSVAPAAGGDVDQQPVPDPGIRITFMRVS